mgnify:CR=1 FL=1
MLSRVQHVNVFFNKHPGVIYYRVTPRGYVLEDVVVYGRRLLKGKRLRVDFRKLKKRAEKVLEKGVT